MLTERAVELPLPRPGFVSNHGRPLFAWHHSPPRQLRRGIGIVLCPPLGYEYVSAYRTWRVLAARLAAIGFDALRVDYDGTGDSTGSADESDRVGAWLRGLANAIAETRTVAGTHTVALIGLRAGALLALQAAQADGSVARLALWGSPTSGRAYVRELKACARLLRQPHADEDDGPGINAAGHVVSAATVDSLARWALEDITTRAADQVLIMDRDDRPSDPALAAHLEALGSQVTRVQSAGLADLLAPPESAQLPETALDTIVAWFDRWPVPSTLPVRGGAGERGLAPIAAHASYRERPVRFGPGGRLFGIVTSPAADVRPAAALILPNTSVEPHVGPNRFYVPLARELAARGHTVLRFDLGGIGDSIAPRGVHANAAYPDHMLDDAREAVAFVRSEAPDREIVMAGLCSGGWLTFLAARELLDVNAVVSINPPLYLLDGAPAKQWVTEGRELARYRRSMRDPSKWVKALRGGASYATFTRVAVRTLARNVAVGIGEALGDGASNRLAQALAAIARRQIRSLFVFCAGDDGLRYFQLHASRALRSAPTRDFIRHVVVEGAGHSFSPRAAQRSLRELLIDFMASPAAAASRSEHDAVTAAEAARR